LKFSALIWERGTEKKFSGNLGIYQKQELLTWPEERERPNGECARKEKKTGKRVKPIRAADCKKHRSHSES